MCIRDCELVRVSRAAFERIAQRHPAVMRRFTEVLARRYHEVRACALTVWRRVCIARLTSLATPGTADDAPVRWEPAPSDLCHTSRRAAAGMWSTSSHARLYWWLRPWLTPRAGGAGAAAVSNLVTITLVPAGESPPEISVFASALSSGACAERGSVRHAGEALNVLSAALDPKGRDVLLLTAAAVDSHLGPGTSARCGDISERIRVSSWLNAMVCRAVCACVLPRRGSLTPAFRRRSIVLLCLLPTVLRRRGQPWQCSRCDRRHVQRSCFSVTRAQADCVLLIGMAHTAAALSELERSIVFPAHDGAIACMSWRRALNMTPSFPCCAGPTGMPGRRRTVVYSTKVRR